MNIFSATFTDVVENGNDFVFMKKIKKSCPSREGGLDVGVGLVADGVEAGVVPQGHLQQLPLPVGDVVLEIHVGVELVELELGEGGEVGRVGTEAHLHAAQAGMVTWSLD